MVNFTLEVQSVDLTDLKGKNCIYLSHQTLFYFLNELIVTDVLILILELYKHNYERGGREQCDREGKKYRNGYNCRNSADGDRKGQAFSINCRVTIRPVLREIAALYLNMNINDICLCWLWRALTF